MGTSKSKVWIWVIVAIIVIAAVVVAWRRYYAPRLSPRVPSAGLPAAPLTAGAEDTTANIQKDLGTVDLGNPGQDVNQLNQDINQL